MKNVQQLTRKGNEEEKRWVLENKDLIDKIIRNERRVGILYLLAKSEQGFLKPKEMAYKLGVYPRSVMYHLDKLLGWNLVKIHSRDQRGYRKEFELNDKFPNWVELVLKKGIITHGEKNLQKIISVNKKQR